MNGIQTQLEQLIEQSPLKFGGSTLLYDRCVLAKLEQNFAHGSCQFGFHLQVNKRRAANRSKEERFSRVSLLTRLLLRGLENLRTGEPTPSNRLQG